MLNLEKYKGVIKMVYAESIGQSADEFYASLTRSLKIAQALSGELEPQSPTPTVAEFRRPAPPAAELQAAVPVRGKAATAGGIILSFEPPVQGADEVESDEYVDEWETAPGRGDGVRRLERKLQQVMPLSITAQVPGVDEPLKLVRGVATGPMSVFVSYTLPGSGMGPRIQIMTSTKEKEIDTEVLLKDIMEQASASYSKEVRKLTPRPLKPIEPPNDNDLGAMLQRDRAAQSRNDGLSGDEAVASAKLAEEWKGSRSVDWQ